MIAVKKTLRLDRSFQQIKRSSVLLQHVVFQQAKRTKIGKENSQYEKSDTRSFFHVTAIISSTPRRDDTDMEIVSKTTTIDD